MKSFIFLSVMMTSMTLFIPSSVRAAAGLGEAGSITLEGLVIGLAVLGVIFLVFMGLLLLARVSELTALSQKPEKDLPVIHVRREDIMSLDATEINRLLHDRKENSSTAEKATGICS